MPRPIGFKFSTLKGLLQLSEYHYRKGVLDGANAGDTEEVYNVANREDAYTTVRYLNTEPVPLTRKRAFEIHGDHIIGLSRQLHAEALADFLRFSNDFTTRREIFAVLDLTYRIGLLHGVKLRNREKAIQYYNSLKRGTLHEFLFKRYQYGTRWTTFAYADIVKCRVNQVHVARREAKAESTADKLSFRIGELCLKEKLKNRHDNLSSLREDDE
jgi:hypothetical protein